MRTPCQRNLNQLTGLTDFQRVNIFLDRSNVMHDSERLLDHSRSPLSAERALVAHVCITRGLILGSMLNVGGTIATRTFWTASLELKDHVLSRRNTIEKFIVSFMTTVPVFETTSLSRECTHILTGSYGTGMVSPPQIAPKAIIGH